VSTTTQAYLNLKGYKEFASQNRPDPAGRLGLETIAESSLSGKARRNTGISGREPGSTSGSLHGVGDLFTALRRQGLIADELVLQLATFLRSLDLFLELIVWLRELSQPTRFGMAASKAQIIPSFPAFIPAPAQH
jgi:hypothetical protein